MTMLFGNGKVAVIGSSKARQLIQVQAAGGATPRTTGDFLTQAMADSRYAGLGHTHTINQITGLQGALDALAAAPPSTHGPTHQFGGSDPIAGQLLSGLQISDTPQFNGLKIGATTVLDSSRNATLGGVSATGIFQIGKGKSDTAEAGSMIELLTAVGGPYGWGLQLGAGKTLDFWTKNGSNWALSARMDGQGIGCYSGSVGDTITGSCYLQLADNATSPSAGWTLQVGSVGDLAFWGYDYNSNTWKKPIQFYSDGSTLFAGAMTLTSLASNNGALVRATNNAGKLGFSAVIDNGTTIALNRDVTASDAITAIGAVTCGDLYLPHYSAGQDGALVFLNRSLGGKLAPADGAGGTIYFDVGGLHVKSTINVHASVSPNYGPGMNFEASTAPTTPSSGDVWFDGTNMKMRVGSVTKTFAFV